MILTAFEFKTISNQYINFSKMKNKFMFIKSTNEDDEHIVITIVQFIIGL